MDTDPPDRTLIPASAADVNVTAGCRLEWAAL
jgi:hypothetical protein